MTTSDNELLNSPRAADPDDPGEAGHTILLTFHTRLVIDPQDVEVTPFEEP